VTRLKAGSKPKLVTCCSQGQPRRILGKSRLIWSRLDFNCDQSRLEPWAPCMGSNTRILYQASTIFGLASGHQSTISFATKSRVPGQQSGAKNDPQHLLHFIVQFLIFQLHSRRWQVIFDDQPIQPTKKELATIRMFSFLYLFPSLILCRSTTIRRNDIPL
jgi:hypothetical protein